MNAGRLIILRASRLSSRDAARRMSATEPSQQQLRRSSGSVAAALIQPSTPRSWQHLEEGRELLLLRSINSLAAASAPLKQRQQAKRQCPATMSGRRGLLIECRTTTQA